MWDVRGRSALWSPFPLAKDHCSAECQNKESLQDKAVLPFALWLGRSRAACSELCQAPFGGIPAVTDEPSGITLKLSMAFTQQEPTGMAKQLHTFPCHGGWGLGHYWAQQQRCVCHAGENRDPVRPCPPGDRLSGSKKNEGLSGAAVFY